MSTNPFTENPSTNPFTNESTTRASTNPFDEPTTTNPFLEEDDPLVINDLVAINDANNPSTTTKIKNPFVTTTKNLVIIGDSSTGKTALLVTFARDRFPPEFTPISLEQITDAMTVDDTELGIELSLRDTVGRKEYDNLRTSSSYENTDLILVCFSVDDPQSFRNVESKWAPEAKRNCPSTVPLVLVGTKSDLRDSRHPSKVDQPVNRKEMVSEEDAELMAKKIDAKMYVECSVKEIESVRKMFQMAAMICLEG